MPFTSRSTAGTTAWTCPYGVHHVKAVAIGSGGAGGQRSSGNNSGAAGGRGGGIGIRHALTVVPATSYNLVVGAVGTDGATPANGGNSTFTGSALSATGGGGASCAANSQTAPSALGASVGDVTWEGGAGGAGASASGGGGGGAGYSAVGGDASGSTAGVGVIPGGDGAAGRSTTGTGATATGVGGGGAGGRRGTSGTQTGGNGAPGYVLVRWHAPNLMMMLGVGT